MQNLMRKWFNFNRFTPRPKFEKIDVWGKWNSKMKQWENEEIEYFKKKHRVFTEPEQKSPMNTNTTFSATWEQVNPVITSNKKKPPNPKE